jgi:DNA-binding NarL/FixJ family response regulator
MYKIKVLIADDHAVVRQGLKHIIARDPRIEVVGEAENGNEVLEKVKVLDIDVILMDIEMPEKNGMETLTQLKDSDPNIPVIILSIFQEELYGLRLIQSGASSYLSKTCPPNQLLEAIYKVANGGKYITPSLGELLVKNMDNESNKPIHESLSNREYQVFFMIASGKKQKDIAAELSISINTVNVHRANILKKINAKSNSEIMRYALQNNLIK